jgi:hypothetical protein
MFTFGALGVLIILVVLLIYEVSATKQAERETRSRIIHKRLE